MDPNPSHALVVDIAREITTNKELYESKAREWTLQYAMPPEGSWRPISQDTSVSVDQAAP